MTKQVYKIIRNFLIVFIGLLILAVILLGFQIAFIWKMAKFAELTTYYQSTWERID